MNLNKKFDSSKGWMRKLDEKRKVNKRLDFINSMRQGSQKPLPKRVKRDTV